MRMHIPWWLTLIIVIETLPMFIGPYVALTFPPMMGGSGAEEINQAAYIYTARNLAVGFALIIAFILKSAPMLFILIFVRLFTDLVDLPTILQFGLASNLYRTASIFVFLYYIPAVFALWYLWKQMRKDDPAPSP
ncbi:MAG: hypothetical protein ACFB6R_16580 [Alphaproteobacteria bacterium]